MTATPVALVAETFEPHLGQAFQVRGAIQVLTLTAIDRRALAAWETDLPRAPFILVFSGPPVEVLAEGLHRIEAGSGEAYDLYLIPIHTPAPGGQDYQAVFN